MHEVSSPTASGRPFSEYIKKIALKPRGKWDDWCDARGCTGLDIYPYTWFTTVVGDDDSNYMYKDGSDSVRGEDEDNDADSSVIYYRLGVLVICIAAVGKTTSSSIRLQPVAIAFVPSL
ncbi:hypothetical protein QAD02_015263 [Eretmocerus hayati]|uniref:Uncharacterized protein n=1 Tax=Eretmocerus hayati TaxID=131215 RepID=A0ACC2P7Q6_9HYME|nr:hypothetical protein QAD02_015263 [Eretmocerus hayati]